jgi:hypothetical protein
MIEFQGSLRAVAMEKGARLRASRAQPTGFSA